MWCGGGVWLVVGGVGGAVCCGVGVVRCAAVCCGVLWCGCAVQNLISSPSRLESKKPISSVVPFYFAFALWSTVRPPSNDSCQTTPARAEVMV